MQRLHAKGAKPERKAVHLKETKTQEKDLSIRKKVLVLILKKLKVKDYSMIDNKQNKHLLE